MRKNQIKIPEIILSDMKKILNNRSIAKAGVLKFLQLYAPTFFCSKYIYIPVFAFL